MALGPVVAIAGCSSTATTDGWSTPGAGGSPAHDGGSGGGGGVGGPEAGSSKDAGHPSSGDAGSGGGADAGGGGDEAGEGGVADAGPSPEAGSSGGPTPEQQAWLDPQNAARAAVGEAPLAWDPIAAQVAQAYASQCSFQHNPDRNSQYDALGGSGGLGENISAGAPTQDVAGAVGSWVGEQSDYDHASNTCASGKECGHYTQIVWNGTTAVGCAKVSCTTGSPFGTFASGQWDFSVCDYSPPGNVVGQSPY